MNAKKWWKENLLMKVRLGTGNGSLILYELKKLRTTLQYFCMLLAIVVLIIK